MLVFHILYCAHGDLPVHCLRHQVVGDWEFYLGPASSERLSCGHRRPDNEEVQPALSELQTDRTLQVSLLNPNVATTSSDHNGRWTMIYDEAFEVNIEGISFLAFSRYDLSYKNGTRTNTSHCGETQIGWYQSSDRTQFGCYYGKKKQPSHHAGQLSLLAHAPTRSHMSPKYDEPLDDGYHSTFATFINFLQDSWIAKAHSWLTGKSLRNMNDRAGIYRSLPISEHHSKNNRPSPSFLQREGHTNHWHSGTGEPLPVSWDWRNVSGVNYLDRVLDQDECGSCYTVATIRMLSARHRIRQQDPTLEPFSINFPLYCSEYTQGCDGGYAFLVSRWSQDVGLVPESCGMYAAKWGQCQMNCRSEDLSQRWRADNHHYVGGYYGGVTEHEMMRELVQGGPLVASFEPTNELMYYGGGIYHKVPHKRAEWEQVDHAVLLVGFGEEAGKKYWILQNSWGPEWGEEGYFRMQRGTDESGIESLVVAADVVEDKQPVVLQQFMQSL